MSVTTSYQDKAFVIEDAAAEVVGLPEDGAFRLLADASATGGALSANRLTLGEGREPFDALLPEQERYDVHFQDAASWNSRRAR